MIATMTHRIKLGSHTYFHMKKIPINYLDIVIPSLAQLSSVLPSGSGGRWFRDSLNFFC